MIQIDEQEFLKIDSWTEYEQFLEREKARLRPIAEALANDPLGDDNNREAIYLSAYGCLDSTEAMPGFIYRLYCTPLR